MSRYLNASRRRFLALLGALFVINPIAGRSQAQQSRATDDSDAIIETLCNVYRCPTSAIVVGEAYLRSRPKEANPIRLTKLICSNIPKSYTEISTFDTGMVRKLVQKQLRTDFENGRTVLVDGWILSETEARLCALKAVSSS